MAVSVYTGAGGGVASFNGRTGKVVPADGDYTKAQVGLSNVDNVKQYSKSNPPPYPVTSVAGKTGAVTLAASDVGAVPTTRTVNKKALSSNITLSAADVGAVPTSRTVNGKALSSNITLSATDVGALPTSGGTLTGNLAGKYITGTWLQTTEVSDKAGDFATIDSDGWIYKRTASEANEDIITGHNINPRTIELFPGNTAGHGGYIDFHYNNDAADFTSRIIENPSGYVQLNGMGIMTRANIAAVYNVSAQFTNGIFEYSNSVIKAGTICFAQFRGGRVSSSFQDTALATSSEAGKVKIVAKNGATFNTNVNVLMINL